MPLTADTRALIASINKKYGAGSILTASDASSPPPFPTGSLSVDSMMAGGFPANQWTEILGKESSGKTSFVHKTVANNQKINPAFSTFWVAAEGYESDWASRLGVDTSRVAVFNTCAMEEAYTVLLEAIASREFDCVVLDSYPALIADDEDEKEIGESSVALGARVTGKFFRKAGKAGRRSLTEPDRPFFGVFINQYRAQIGGWAPPGQTAVTSPGGTAKDYACYVRLQVTKKEELKEPAPGGLKRRVGQAINFKTIKSKVSPPGQTMSVDFYVEDTASGFTCGDYDIAKEMMGLGLYHGVIGQKSAYYLIGDEQWHGKVPLLAAIRDSADLQKVIYEGVMEATRG